MTKKKLQQFIREDLAYLSTKQKLEKIEKMYPMFTEVLDELKEDVKKGQIYCPECKQYYPEKNFSIEHDIHSVEQATYIDAGYGDDDRWGEVEYAFTYLVCPKNCNHKIEKERTYIRTLWEKGKNN